MVNIKYISHIFLFTSLHISFLIILSASTDPLNISVQACGTHLADTIRILCKSIYNGPMTYQNDQQYLESDVDRSVKFLPKEHALRILNSRRSKRYGVANECCQKACTRSQILDYCRHG
nr:bombyxin F-1-like isoform X1 [Onthophagus taurus]